MRNLPIITLVAVLAGCANHAKQAIALYETGDYAGAKRAAVEGLQAHPDDDALWGMRVRAAVALGDRREIRAAYGSYRTQRGEDDRELVRDLAIATLGQALASPSAKLKLTAIETIAAAQLEVFAEAVTMRMDDNDDRVVAAAAIAVLHAHPQAPQIADDMLRSEDPEARRIVVDGIGRKVGAIAARELRAAVLDPDPRVRIAAIRWLGTLRDREAFEVIARQLRHPDVAVRAVAASALAKIGIGNLGALGKQALGDQALAVRLAGIELLVAAKRSDELVAIAQRDTDPMVALEAAIAAKRTDLAAPALERAIKSDDWTDRAGAANSAARALGTEQATELARRLVNDTDGRVRLAAGRVLAHAGQRDAAVAVFVAALSAPDLAIDAAGELAELGDQRGIDLIDAALSDAQRPVDQRMAAITAHRSARVVTPGLIAAIADPSSTVRVAAAAVLIALSA
ncbi:MAG: HEAT repeat domain-containing protein [Kofleriaceae bacterium]